MARNRNKSQTGRTNSTSETLHQKSSMLQNLSESIRKTRDEIRRRRLGNPDYTLPRRLAQAGPSLGATRRLRERILGRQGSGGGVPALFEIQTKIGQVGNSVCDQRKTRKEVMHALGRTGKGGSGNKKPSYSYKSKIRCK